MHTRKIQLFILPALDFSVIAVYNIINKITSCAACVGRTRYMMYTNRKNRGTDKLSLKTEGRNNVKIQGIFQTVRR